MKALTLPIIGMTFQPKIGKTSIDMNYNGITLTAFANGNCASDDATLCSIVLNEVGDKFVAQRDSRTLDENNEPVFKAGDTVTRLKESVEFKALTGRGSAAQFAQAAKAHGLQLIVQMA